eukprot:CAMPEP_0171542282 /NCGR_PEP_ID=MMETSP0960-20121227/2263_1 /TAXON_ID=87120 /ORGANISM="Aurantiochytrium limacinum, Strain ATCCMYA-1381" /LENGTH=143 /DNA_ID=CAMNT_0012089771 /DNA_START=312 /DNA_END=744 /DNA_ORIENTATION=-
MTHTRVHAKSSNVSRAAAEDTPRSRAQARYEPAHCLQDLLRFSRASSRSPGLGLLLGLELELERGPEHEREHEHLRRCCARGWLMGFEATLETKVETLHRRPGGEGLRRTAAALGGRERLEREKKRRAALSADAELEAVSLDR